MGTTYSSVNQSTRAVNTDGHMDREPLHNVNDKGGDTVVGMKNEPDDESVQSKGNGRNGNTQTNKLSSKAHATVHQQKHGQNNSANHNNASTHSNKVISSKHSNYSSESSLSTEVDSKKRKSCTCLSNCCVPVIISAVVALVTTVLVHVYLTTSHSSLIKVYDGKVQGSPKTDKLTGGRPTFSCAQLYLDRDRFEENKTMRWVYGSGDSSSYSRDVMPDDSSPSVTIKIGGLYSIWSKITFNLRKHETEGTIFHTVVLHRKRETSPRILEKNTITLVDSSVRQDSFKVPSTIHVLTTLQAEDQIYIGVPDTAIVFPSRVDNTLQLIKYG